MQLTPSQSEAVFSPARALVVVAGAGSGKTRVLVERYVRLLGQAIRAGYEPDALVACTFTEKAAREMRERVRAAIGQLSHTAPPGERLFWDELHSQIDAAPIGTIHSFCATLLRAHPAETGLDPLFDVLDDVQAATLALRAAERALVGATNDDSAERRALLGEYSLPELRDILTDLLARGATARAAQAATSGDPAQLIALTQAALSTLHQRAADAILADPRWRDATETILALARSAPQKDMIGQQLQRAAHLLAAEQTPQTLIELGTCSLQGGSAKAWGSKETLVMARAALRALREIVQSHHVYLRASYDAEFEERAARATAGLVQLIAHAAEVYREEKATIRALDFDDLEQHALTLLQQNGAIRQRWQRHIFALFVDEFQDTSPEQRDIVYALAGFDTPTLTDDVPYLFIVADGKQSIYRFRGADVSVFTEARRAVERRGGQTVMLDDSFRTQARLVDAVNQMFAHIFARNGPLKPFEVGFEALRSTRPPSPHPQAMELWLTERSVSGEKIPIGDMRHAEAQALAARIAHLVASGAPIVFDAGEWRAARYGDFALLFQASTVFETYEDALREAGVPFLTTAGRGYYGRNEVRDLVHLLQALEDPTDQFALVGALRSPLFAIDDTTIVRLRMVDEPLWQALQHDTAEETTFARTVLRDLAALRGRVTVVMLLREILARTGYLATISGLRDGERRRVNVEKLLNVARSVGGADLAVFGAYLERLLRLEARESEAPLEGEDAVRIMTVHRAKGLEFPIVVLPDMGRDLPTQQPKVLMSRAHGLALRLRDGTELRSPIRYQLAADDVRAEEQAERERLAYVALTRARDYVILAGPADPPSGDDWLSMVRLGLGMPWDADASANAALVVGSLTIAQFRVVPALPSEQESLS